MTTMTPLPHLPGPWKARSTAARAFLARLLAIAIPAAILLAAAAPKLRY